MINKNDIKGYLKKYIKQGIDRFVIYPFGENGMNVKNILKEYFDIIPILIVDNEYAKFNSSIVDGERLKEKYSKDMYVILTIEDKKANAAILKQLQEFVPEANIINLVREVADPDSFCLSNFYLSDFLPDAVLSDQTEKAEEHLTGKIKVRFLVQTLNTWNTIKTIYTAFQKDDSFDLMMIAGHYALGGQIKEFEIPHIPWTDYHVEDDCPDILILSHPYDYVTQIENCKRYCKLVIVASMQLIRYTYDMKSFFKMQGQAYGRFQPDYYLFDSLLYNEIMQSNYASKRFIEMGNAKFDGIFMACQEKKYIKGWEKLKGKKVILWTTDHGMIDYNVTKDLTFDLYAKKIFQYIKEHEEVGFIFRPHPTFISEMLRNGFWSTNDLEMIKDYCQRSSNIVFDNELTYDNAFSIADGILTDAFCGITCSALPTLKPICLAYRSKTDLPYHVELANCCYSAYSSEDILSFFELVKSGKDNMLEARKQASQKYVKHFDGENGQRIKEFIKNKFLTL